MEVILSFVVPEAEPVSSCMLGKATLSDISRPPAMQCTCNDPWVSESALGSGLHPWVMSYISLTVSHTLNIQLL